MDAHYDNKIKTFRFTVSNASSAPMSVDKNNEHFQKLKKEIVSEETIDKTINAFLKDKLLVDIKTTTIDVQYHNNARGNTIALIYTVIYREQKSHVTVNNQTHI